MAGVEPTLPTKRSRRPRRSRFPSMPVAVQPGLFIDIPSSDEERNEDTGTCCRLC